MNVPENIRIGPFDYAVKLKKKVDGDGSFGYIEYSQRHIRMLKGMAPSAHLEVLWHEAIHGIMHEHGIAGEHPEPLVTKLAFGICQLLRDNPYLRGEHLFDPAITLTGIDAKGDEVQEDVSAEDFDINRAVPKEWGQTKREGL